MPNFLICSVSGLFQGIIWSDLQRRSGKPAEGRINIEIITTESRDTGSPSTSEDEGAASTASTEEDGGTKRRPTSAGAALKKAGKVLLLGHLRGNSASVNSLSVSPEHSVSDASITPNSSSGTPKIPKQSRHRHKASLQISSVRGFNSTEALASPSENRITRLGSFNSSTVLVEKDSEQDTQSLPSMSMENDSILSGTDPNLQPEVTGVSLLSFSSSGPRIVPRKGYLSFRSFSFLINSNQLNAGLPK
jgi:hypothetical protein